MHTKTAFVLVAAFASASTMGCGSGGGGSPGTNNPTGAVRASLHRAQACGDLLADLRADAAYKLNKGIDLQIQNIKWCQQKYGDAQCAGGGYYNGGVGHAVAVDDAAPPQASPESPTSGANSSFGDGKSSGDSATSYSQTNTQVAGVDEADIVKNDGKNLYVLHGNSFKIINAWPATELKEVSSTDIEGTPSEMFVDNGKAVIYSQVNGAAIFAAAGVTPKTQYQDYGYGVAYSGVATPAIAPAPAPDAPSGTTSGGVYVPLTKITVLSLDGAAPTVTREVYFEGSYLDARRVDAHVRTVLQGYQYGPQLKYSIYELYPQPATNGVATKDGTGSTTTQVEPQYPKTGTETIAALEQLRAANLQILNASQLPDWLPYTFVKNGAAVSAQTVACEDFYVPTAGSTESGLTEVASIDLSDPAAAPKETAILGRVDTVYGNADTLYLAANAWIEPPFVWYDGAVAVSNGGTVATPPSSGSTTSTSGTTGSGTTVVDPTPPKPAQIAAKTAASLGDSLAAPYHWSSSLTHVHKFEFKTQPTFPNYVASGTVVGSVNNQFSLDEKDGNLRIATTEGRQYYETDGKYVSADSTAPTNGAPPPVNPATLNHVFVLSQNGAWLDQLGDVGDLAPNERIQSVRFVDGRGYVVTFRQVDPLFVVDLSAPATPRILGALKIPGFSEYMHPLDANHLLTIGRDASTTGRANGLQLQIFDVTNGTNPQLVHQFTYTGTEYGGSDAEYDHKAFTYFADRNLLAFPYYSYGTTVHSSLELFKVDLGAGFTKLGAIDNTALIEKNPSGYCGGYYGPSVRRGVFLENFVYSVSYGGVVAKDSNDLTQAGTQLALPAPEVNAGYGPVCAY
jgi:uncharacterized secreted protein with C-terminal beta-propeller domain